MKDLQKRLIDPLNIEDHLQLYLYIIIGVGEHPKLHGEGIFVYL